MKYILIFITLTSTSAFAETNLVCCDQNSHSIYKLSLNSENNITFSPIVKDSSILSEEEIRLKLNEGESSDAATLFTGKLPRNNNIAIELKKEDRNIIEGTIFYSFEDSKTMNHKTTILCSHE